MTNKLFMVMLGATPQGRHIEQHDIYFGIGTTIKELVPSMKEFWQEAGPKLHMDAWREVTKVQDYKIEVVNRTDYTENGLHLFFINLGGYKQGVFDEFHQTYLLVANSLKDATQRVKNTTFFQEYNLPPIGNSHIDNKYGVDIDDIYEISEIVSSEFKQNYAIQITPLQEQTAEDEIALGYMKLSS